MAENDPIVGQSNLTATLYIFAPNAAYTELYTNAFAPIATAAGVSIV